MSLISLIALLHGTDKTIFLWYIVIAGGSSGAAMSVALEKARSLKAGQKCVVLLPDSVRNYMTKFLSDKWLADRDIIQLSDEEKLW